MKISTVVNTVVAALILTTMLGILVVGQSSTLRNNAKPTPTPTPTPIPTPTPGDCTTTIIAGCLDLSFGNGGKVATTINASVPVNWANALAVQLDGKVVAAVTYSGAIVDCYVARYMPDGSLDTSFGGNGSGIPGVSRFSLTPASDQEYVSAVAVDASGRIIVGANVSASGTTPAEFAIARLNSDGTLDASFGNNGKVLSNYAGAETGYLWTLTIDPNGRIIGCGGSADANSYSLTQTDTFGFVALLPSGAFDTSFNGSGKRSIPTTSAATGGGACHGVAIQADGKIVAAGGRPPYRTSGRSTTATGQDFAAMRIDPNGALDTSFGTGGIVYTDFNLGNDNANGGLALEAPAADGTQKIVAAGQARPPSGGSQLALVRYLSNGSLDPSFGVGGKQTTAFGGLSLLFEGITIRSDNEIIGGAHATGSPSNDFLIARYTSNGVLDPSFGPAGNGIVRTDFGGGSDDQAWAFTMQPDGKYVLAGQTGGSIGLARYLP